MSDLDIQINQASIIQIETHLALCDSLFTPPLSSRVRIHDYAVKIYEKAFRLEAFDNEKLVGLIAIYIDNKSSYAFITNISVLAEYHGMGIADKLMGKSIQELMSVGVCKIELEVNRNNTKAVNLYTKYGYHKNNEAGDNIIMAVDLKIN